jgi:nucleoside 2-deoxyribosyltransferase
VIYFRIIARMHSRGHGMNKYRIYLAGPLFTVAEREFNLKLARSLRRHHVFLPQVHQKKKTPPKLAFDTDVHGIDRADVVVANMDGPDPDSGTCWECGYAYARGIPTIIYRTDFRSIDEPNKSPYNLMLTASATMRIDPHEIEGTDGYPQLKILAERIHDALRSPEIERAIAQRQDR